MSYAVHEIILNQLGGNKFLAMTGANHLSYAKNILYMHLTKNKSKANRLSIKLEANDTYTMRFYKYTAPNLNRKTLKFTEEKTVEITKFERVYNDQLQSIYTQVTEQYTHL